MDYRDELLQMGLKMKKKSELLHKRLSTMPKGSLQVINEENRIKYNHIITIDGVQHRYGIKRKPDLMRELTLKAYNKEYLRRLDYNILLLRNMVKKMEQLDESVILEQLPDNYKLLPPECFGKWIPSKMNPVFNESVPIEEAKLVLTDIDVSSWATKPYRANTINRTMMHFKTTEGFRMRSKSEVAIFDIYKKHGFAVHYDELMIFNGTIKSPDFVAVRYDGKVIIHEHCGRVNDKEYMKAHEEKMILYKQCGFVPWDNLIVTYDTPEGGLDLKLVEAEICAKLDF